MDETIAHRSWKERQRQEREALILQTAEEVLLEKGYYETSMDEIAARVGIAKGTLYLHFARKEDLICALIERELQAALHMVEQARTMQGTARAKLEIILDSLYRGVFAKRARIFYVLYNGVDFRALKDRLHDQLGDTMTAIARHLVELFEEGKAAHEFDASLPAEVMASIFFSILSPQAYKHLVLEKQMSLDDLLQCMKRIYFKGIEASS
jgi:TetR/AcrR family fatty acid metabolism transcriptional regulator